MMKYLYLIERGDDGSWSAHVPDLTGCTSCGDMLDELKANIAESVGLYIESLCEHGEPVPPPTVQTGTVEAA